MRSVNAKKRIGDGNLVLRLSAHVVCCAKYILLLPSRSLSSAHRLGRGLPPSQAVVNQLNTVLAQSDSDDDDFVEPEDKNKTRDHAVGMAAYRRFREKELTTAMKPGWFGGFENRPVDSDTRRAGGEAPKKKHSKLRNDTMVARQLQLLPTFTPYFIYFITFVQVRNRAYLHVYFNGQYFRNLMGSLQLLLHSSPMRTRSLPLHPLGSVCKLKLVLVLHALTASTGT